MMHYTSYCFGMQICHDLCNISFHMEIVRVQLCMARFTNLPKNMWLWICEQYANTNRHYVFMNVHWLFKQSCSFSMMNWILPMLWSWKMLSCRAKQLPFRCLPLLFRHRSQSPKQYLQTSLLLIGNLTV